MIIKAGDRAGGRGAPTCAPSCTAADNVLDGPNGLPAITTPITIHGQCATIERDPTADAFRFFNVRPGGSLTLYDLTFTGGSSGTSDGGAIDAHGPVAVTNVTFANNTADDGGAIAIDDGTLTVTSSTFTNNAAISNGGAIDLDDIATSGCPDGRNGRVIFDWRISQ